MRNFTLLLLALIIAISAIGQNEQWDDQFISTNAPNGEVLAFTKDITGNIYISGSFTQAGGVTVNYVAKWDGASWSAIGSGFNGPVHTLAHTGSVLIAGGLFTTAGGNAASNIAYWDGSDWLTFGTGINGIVRAIHFFDGIIYIGGEFTEANGENVNNIVRTNGVDWEALEGGVNGPVYTLSMRTVLYVGGLFTQADGNPALNAAIWTGSAWITMGDGFNGAVHKILWTSSGVYAAGAFTASGALSCSRVAVWDGSAWHSLSGGFDDDVYSVAVIDTTIYAAGKFLNSGTTAVNRIAKMSSSVDWSPLGDGVNGIVRVLFANEYDLYLGGSFTEAGGKPSQNIARWASKPVIISQPNQFTLCENQQLELWVDVWSSETLTYEWRKDNVAIPSSNSDTYTIASMSPADAGIYTCFITNIFGEVESQEIEVVVNTLPSFTLTPSNLVLCEADTLVFSVSASSTLPISYTWFYNSNLINGATDTVYKVNGVNSVNAGTYYAVATNSCGIATSNNFTLAVNSLPTVSISGLSNYYCYTGESDTIIVSPAGGVLTGPNLNNNIFKPYGLIGNHTFTYTYTDNNNCTNKAQKTVHVYNPNPVTISNYNVFYCLYAPSDTIKAIPLGGYFTGALINDSVFSPIDAGVGQHNISYYYEDNNGCMNADTVKITVMEQVSFTYLDLESKFCENEPPVAIYPFPPTGTFVGTGMDGNVFSPNVAGEGVHEIHYIFSDPWGCSATDTLFLAVVPVTEATLSGLPAQICKNEEPIVVNGQPMGGTFYGDAMVDSIFDPMLVPNGLSFIYYIYVDGNSCSDTAYGMINVLPVEQAFFSGLDPFYCQNEAPDTLEAIPAGGVFTGNGMVGNVFYPNIAGEGTHTIIYEFENLNGCSSWDSLSIEVAPNPTISLGIDKEICEGESVELTATYDPSNTLYWNTTDSVATIIVSPTQTTVYSATVYDGTCFNKDSLLVEVNPIPTIIIADSFSNCDFVELSVDASYENYLWSNGLTSPEITVTITNEYHVTVTSDKGCSTSVSTDVTVWPSPSIDLGPNLNIETPEVVNFTLSDEYDFYLWSDGTSSHNFTFDSYVYGVGTHTVYVFVQNDNGCYDMDTVIISVSEGINVDLTDLYNNISIYPNPAQERFFITIPELLACNKIEIYNTAGQIVYWNSPEKIHLGIDITRWTSGLYLVHFYFENTIITRKISVY